MSDVLNPSVRLLTKVYQLDVYGGPDTLSPRSDGLVDEVLPRLQPLLTPDSTGKARLTPLTPDSTGKARLTPSQDSLVDEVLPRLQPLLTPDSTGKVRLTPVRRALCVCVLCSGQASSDSHLSGV